MHTTILCSVLSVLVSILSAQEAPLKVGDTISLLEYTSANEYILNRKSHHNIFQEGPQSFTTIIQIGGKTFPLQFSKDELFDSTIKITSSSKRKLEYRSRPKIYKAKSLSNSILAILLITENSIQLQISIGSVNMNLTKDDKRYLLGDSNLKSGNSYECFSSVGDFQSVSNSKSSTLKSDQRLDLKVSLEVDYTTFIDNNASINVTIEWITSVYATVAAIYDIHNVNVVISEIHIWDTPDPYLDISGLTNILSVFGSRIQNDHNGDVVQLLSSRSMGGGLAHVDQLCKAYDSNSQLGPYCISGNLDIGEVPAENYSWNAYVTAHELGHVIGSLHTQACVWGPNNNEALDNCFATEGGCPKGPEPQNGGTIMSYCFMKPQIGINFSNGFGLEPGNLIYDKIQNKLCNIPSCDVWAACDDGDNCTINDKWDIDCICRGELLDFNENDECDFNENCPVNVNVDTLPNPPAVLMASNMIMSSIELPSGGNIIYNAGQEIYLNPGFEISDSTTFLSYIEGCNQE